MQRIGTILEATQLPTRGSTPTARSRPSRVSAQGGAIDADAVTLLVVPRTNVRACCGEAELCFGFCGLPVV